MSDKIKQTISNAKKGKCFKEENPFYGHRHTDETKKAISDKKRGKPLPKGCRKGQYKPIRGISIKTSEVKEYEYLRAVKHDGFDPSHAGACANGKEKHHKQFRWEWIDEQ